MDLSSLTGGGAPAKNQPDVEYTAQAASPIVNGEVKMRIGGGSLTATALFGVAEIAFAEINALEFKDYNVTVSADSGEYTFSRMGEWARRFYDALHDAYNKAVLRSMFIKGGPILTANGDYRFAEQNKTGRGSAPVHVYDNCVAVLPPDLSARRVPLCFVTGMDKGGFELTLKLDTGESYTFAKLGYDTAPFADAVEKQIRALREQSAAAVREIAPSLSAAAVSQIAGIMPQGAAASIGRLSGNAPAFKTALEEKLTDTRAGESYAAFKELCGPERIYIGFKKNETGAGGLGGMLGGLTGGDNGGGLGGMLGGLTGGDNGGGLGGMLGGLMGGGNGGGLGDMLSGLTGGGPSAPYLLWLLAPSPDGQYAAVEFAEADSATFVYNTGGNFDNFAKQLNRALEAINFKREVIRLSDGELLKPEYTDYYMASKRTASLRFVRERFIGRIIHSSPEAWKRKLTEYWSGRVPN